MNTNATTEIRELTAQELDQVTGGAADMDQYEAGVFAGVMTALIGGAIVGLLDWLFG
jgi:hypothetical protein